MRSGANQAIGLLRTDCARCKGLFLTHRPCHTIACSFLCHLHIAEIDHNPANPVFTKKGVDIFFPPRPRTTSRRLGKCPKHGIICLITKYGYIDLYDLESGVRLYMNRISGETIFVTAELEATSGVIGVNKRGQVLSINVGGQTMVPYTLNVLNNTGLAVKLASSANLPGADDRYVQQHNQLFTTGQYSEVAKIADNSPRVRTILVDIISRDANLIFHARHLARAANIEQFKQVQVQPGTPSPILQYFGVLEKGEPNKHESLELPRPVLAQGRKQRAEGGQGIPPLIWCTMPRIELIFTA